MPTHLLALASLLAACGFAGADRPHVVVLVADDLRPDVIGNPAVETPNLGALARGGTVFPNATCAYPLCVPSRAEMLSGRTSFRNGFVANGRLDTNGPQTWAEAMRAAGYHTVYSGKWHTSGRPSARGFAAVAGLYSAGGGNAPPTHPTDHAGRPVTGYTGWVFQTDDGKTKYPEKGVGLTPNTSAQIADEAVSVIRAKRDKPLFLIVNFTAPHDPRLTPPGVAGKYPPARVALPRNFRPEHPLDHGNLKGRDEVLLKYPREPDEVRAELAAYYAVVTDLDRHVGRILAALDETGMARDTLVIFTADHGLAVGSHGLVGKQNMYDHTIRVPLILRGPGVPKGESRAAGCYLRDLYPTVCDLAGVPAPAGLDGKSFAAAIRDKSVEVHPFLTGYFTDAQRMIRAGGWKYVAYPAAGREQLFDLTRDPDELTDLSADAGQQGRKKELREKLRAWLAEQGDAVVTRPGW